MSLEPGSCSDVYQIADLCSHSRGGSSTLLAPAVEDVDREQTMSRPGGRKHVM